MSQPQLTIFGCYDELLVDPSLLQLCAEYDWITIHECPYLDPLCFHVMLEGLFTLVTSPVMWGQKGVNFVSSSGRWTMSNEIVSMVTLVTDRISEGNLGLTIIYCQSDQRKLEPSDMLSTLVQWDSPDPGIVVVKIFTNMPFSPRGILAPPTWM